MTNIVKIRREYRITPQCEMIDHWSFNSESKEEAELADAMANVAKKNGLNANDLQHLFPAVLRMLKSNNEWSQ